MRLHQRTTAVVSDTTFTQNAATSGGGVSLSFDSVLEMRRASLARNRAATSGGGVELDGRQATGGTALSCTGTAFDGNTAASAGGASHVTSVNLGGGWVLRCAL